MLSAQAADRAQRPEMAASNRASPSGLLGTRANWPEAILIPLKRGEVTRVGRISKRDVVRHPFKGFRFHHSLALLKKARARCVSSFRPSRR